ncbi:uncharacterized protein [Rutidosis leptorrhynchoides]|uniref:uncharacterized protein n=1 Tax=Rutidosis leptorrhynchoides TaxID=125765 RepID=UPI003A995469
MILLSLFLQIVLVGLGHRLRSHSSTKSFIVWLTYLSADWVATTSLGFLMRSDKEAFTELAAFWAPFLLLHLGGPDSITAYSLEDDELWLRHLLGFCFQVTVAVYVFCKFQGNFITYLAIPMFVAAIIKYGERIWSLRYASDYESKQSLYSISTRRELEFMKWENPLEDLEDHVRKTCAKSEARYIQTAYTLLYFFKPLFFDFHLRLPNEFVRYEGFSTVLKSYCSTLKLVDTEIGFLYDEFYTKIPLLKTTTGVTLRGISFLCSCSALIAFSFYVVGTTQKQHFTLDIGISFILLLGAVALEFYSIITHCLSNWALLWATKHRNFLSTLIFKANAPKLASNRGNDQATTMFVPQHSLLDNFVLMVYFKPENSLMKYFSTTWRKIECGSSIQNHLLESVGDHDSQHKYDSNEDYKLGFLERQLDKRIRDDGIRRACIKMLTPQRGFGECIITWHLVTELCYRLDKHNNLLEVEAIASKVLSDYMFYILTSQSSLLVNKGNYWTILQDTCINVSINLEVDGASKIRNLLQKVEIFDTVQFQTCGNSVLPDAMMLAQSLQRNWTSTERWRLIREIWVDILAHVSQTCPVKEHIQYLGRGGDLLTRKYLSMAHQGLGSKIHLLQNDQDFPHGPSFYEFAMQLQPVEVGRKELSVDINAPCFYVIGYLICVKCISEWMCKYYPSLDWD